MPKQTYPLLIGLIKVMPLYFLLLSPNSKNVLENSISSIPFFEHKYIELLRLQIEHIPEKTYLVTISSVGIYKSYKAYNIYKFL